MNVPLGSQLVRPGSFTLKKKCKGDKKKKKKRKPEAGGGGQEENAVIPEGLG